VIREPALAEDVRQSLEDTWSPDPKVRMQAVHDLCPCRLQADHPRVWTRLLDMVTDGDPKVRSYVLHVLADGSPRHREADVVVALERMQQDDDAGLRRRARKLMAHYRRTGKVNIL
jgi:hypothetical protein